MLSNRMKPIPISPAATKAQPMREWGPAAIGTPTASEAIQAATMTVCPVLWLKDLPWGWFSWGESRDQSKRGKKAEWNSQLRRLGGVMGLLLGLMRLIISVLGVFRRLFYGGYKNEGHGPRLNL